MAWKSQFSYILLYIVNNREALQHMKFNDNEIKAEILFSRYKTVYSKQKTQYALGPYKKISSLSSDDCLVSFTAWPISCFSFDTTSRNNVCLNGRIKWRQNRQ